MLRPCYGMWMTAHRAEQEFGGCGERENAARTRIFAVETVEACRGGCREEERAITRFSQAGRIVTPSVTVGRRWATRIGIEEVR